MLPIKIALTGAATAAVLTEVVYSVPILWSLVAFLCVLVISKKHAAIYLILIATSFVLLTTAVYDLARGALDPTKLAILDLEIFFSRRHFFLFSYIFVPGIYLSSALNLQSTLPRGGPRRILALRWIRIGLVQIAYRREALMRRVLEIFLALRARGVETTTWFARLLSMQFWLPALASSAIVEALEQIDYWKMLKIDLNAYQGVLRERRWRDRVLESTLDVILAALLGVLVAHASNSYL